jgi:hypothetical protein
MGGDDKERSYREGRLFQTKFNYLDRYSLPRVKLDCNAEGIYG